MTRFCWPQRVCRRGKPLQTFLVYRRHQSTYQLPEDELLAIYYKREERLYLESLSNPHGPGSWDYADYIAAQKNSI